jgi:hypothetical protein
MKSCLKTIMTLVGLVLIGLALLGIFAATQLDKSATTFMQTGLQYVYQTDVEVDDVHVALANPAIEIKGIRIMNPPSFKQEPAVTMEKIRVVIDVPSLFSAAPTLPSVEVLNPHVTVRYRVGEGTNIGELLSNADRFEARRDDSETPFGARRRFRVGELDSDGGTMQFSTNILPVSTPEMKISNFEIEDLENDPLNIGQIGAVLLRGVFTRGITADGVLDPIADKVRDILGPTETDDAV